MSPPGPYPYYIPPRPQSEIDAEQLNTLSIGFLIDGILEVVFSSFFLLYVIFGILMLTGVMPDKSDPSMPFSPGWIFILIGGAVVLYGWVLGICTLIARRFLAERSNYKFLLILAGANCVFRPFGTILGVFTFILLLRPSVKAMFQK